MCLNFQLFLALSNEMQYAIAKYIWQDYVVKISLEHVVYVF